MVRPLIGPLEERREDTQNKLVSENPPPQTLGKTHNFFL